MTAPDSTLNAGLLYPAEMRPYLPEAPTPAETAQAAHPAEKSCAHLLPSVLGFGLMLLAAAVQYGPTLCK